MLAKKFALRKDKENSDSGKGTSGQKDSGTPVVTPQEGTLPLREREERQKVVRLVPIDRIHPNPYQKRLYFDEEKLQELANGMEEHGWVGGGLPVRNDPEEENTYQLVWGERRLRAAKLAGLTAIPCEISAYTDDDMTELGLLENIQRENLTNYELGVAYKSLLELHQDGKPKYSIRSLAKRLGFNDKSAVERMLVYVRAPEDVQEMAKAKPVAPRIVHELTHIETEEERAPIIEAVLKGQTDIEDVRALRKQVSLPEQEVRRTNEELGLMLVPNIVEVERRFIQPHPSPAKSERVERLVIERRIKRDHERVMECLTRWNEDRASLDDKTLPALLSCLAEWEEAIARLKQQLQQQ